MFLRQYRDCSEKPSSASTVSKTTLLTHNGRGEVGKPAWLAGLAEPGKNEGPLTLATGA